MGGLKAAIGFAQKKLFRGQWQVTATDIRVATGQHDILLGLGQGEVMAILIAGHQMNHLAGDAWCHL
ncbi:hypothetical protein D3C84_1287300 [compost metagenome]